MYEHGNSIEPSPMRKVAEFAFSLQVDRAVETCSDHFGPAVRNHIASNQ
jgi:hypothetical protein